MLKSERHQLILNKIEKKGKVLVNELTDEFELTEDTIRKDLQELSKSGSIKRVHGGALRVDNSLINFEQRIQTKKEQKMKIAKLATHLLQMNQVIYIDSGTTNSFFSDEIPLDYAGTVITNSPSIALQLSDHYNVDIFLLPGELNKETKVLQGAATLKALELINIDLCLLGISSLDVDNGITVPSLEESYLKRQIIKQSSHIVGLVTNEKFGTTSTYKVEKVKVIDVIVTEESVSDSLLKPYVDVGIEIVK